MEPLCGITTGHCIWYSSHTTIISVRVGSEVRGYRLGSLSCCLQWNVNVCSIVWYCASCNEQLLMETTVCLFCCLLVSGTAVLLSTRGRHEKRVLCDFSVGRDHRRPGWRHGDHPWVRPHLPPAWTDPSADPDCSVHGKSCSPNPEHTLLHTTTEG